jgi:hypothetical protein
MGCSFLAWPTTVTGLDTFYLIISFFKKKMSQTVKDLTAGTAGGIAQVKLLLRWKILKLTTPGFSRPTF